MQIENRRLILASGSPRRRELLGKMGFAFEICTPDVDEHVPGHASDIVRTLALRKGRAAAKNYSDGVIIASDTLVSLDGAPLGKPEDEAGIHAEIIGFAGNTRYDFFSESRGKEVSNRIQWFTMVAADHDYHISYDQGFLNGGYFPVDRAMELLTFDGDRDILRNACQIYQKYRETIA